MPHRLNQIVDALGLRTCINVVMNTGNNPAVAAKHAAVVERKKMFSIQRQDDPVFGHRDSENSCVAFSIAGLFGVVIPDEFNIMAETSQTILDPCRKLLVGQETRHFQSSSFSRICDSISLRWSSAYCQAARSCLHEIDG